LALLLGAALALASCTRNDEADLLPPPGYVPPAFHPLRGPVPRGPLVRYGAGFYGLESSPAGMTWRWMSKSGLVHLPNDRHDKLLRLAGWVPLELMPEAPTVRIRLGGQELDRFVVSGRSFTRDYPIAAARLGAAPAAEISVETSGTAHAPGDSRELGVCFTTLDWRDATGAASPNPPVGATAGR
jgi:hypothetical protein